MDKHEPTSLEGTLPREPRPVLLAALGNDEADQIVTAMALQATRLWPGAELHLTHVVDVLPVAQAAVASPVAEWSYPGLDDIRRQGGDYLNRFVRSAGEVLGRPAEGHLLFGPPVDEIVRLAGELKASLLVVGSRDLGRLTRLLVGSVAEALLRKAPCSVLLARAPKYAADARYSEVCADCLQAEAASGGAMLRCSRHALEYGRTHGQVGARERDALGGPARRIWTRAPPRSASGRRATLGCLLVPCRAPVKPSRHRPRAPPWSSKTRATFAR